MCFSQPLGFECSCHGTGPTAACLCGPEQAPQFSCPSVSSSEIIIGHAIQGGSEYLSNSIKHLDQCLTHQLLVLIL